MAKVEQKGYSRKLSFRLEVFSETELPKLRSVLDKAALKHTQRKKDG